MDGSVIVPLYVYPSVGMWDPVYTMAATYPQVNFTAIVNVRNGPGEGILPNAEYSHAIGALNSFKNIRTVGYVATTWCTRNLSTVLDDVAAYYFWGNHNTSLAVDGIFFDETPTQYSPDSISYLRTIAHEVRKSGGFKDGYIGRATISYRHCCQTGPHVNPALVPLIVALVWPDRAWPLDHTF
ncbi:Spherulation-specific family 4-domain-containing protein [Phaeosphaeriaceae sp. PMI808]|nr:Spherulation-specific family 4-domain-containing protein [Phaeosphaeriaceae sp. PMI808]